MVELLWELGDAHAVLRDRFGLPGAAAAESWVRSTVETAWGVDAGALTRLVLSDRNALAWTTGPEGDGLLVKRCVDPSRFARLDAVARLVAAVARSGVPVSAPVMALEGSPQVCVGDARVVSSERLRSWSSVARPHLPPGGSRALHDLVGRLPDDPLPVQPLHGDYRAANVLCSEGRVAAVIDFEEAHLGAWLEEAARSAVVLGTRFRDWGPVGPEVRTAFCDGYASGRPLTRQDHAWWDALELWHSLAMVPVGDDPTGWGVAAEEQLAAHERG
ncbi:phosphotransferase [Nocardioides marmoraquaticus]